MSLTGKQIRELNSAYKSVYVKQEPVVENLAITEELFELRQQLSELEKSETVMMKRMNSKIEQLLEDIRG